MDLGFVVQRPGGRKLTELERVILDNIFCRVALMKGRRCGKQAALAQVKSELENMGFVIKPIEEAVPRRVGTCKCTGIIAIADEVAEVDWVTLKAVLEKGLNNG